jgi:hypothetical protein
MKGIKKKTEETEPALDRLGKGMLRFKHLAVGAAVAIAAAFTSSTLENALGDLQFARNIGDDVSSIKVLQQALRTVGQDGSQAGEILGQLAQTIAGARYNSGMRETFERLGLSIDQLAAMKPSAQLATISAAFANLKSPTEQAAFATAIFGDKAGAMLPILAQGSKGLKDAADKTNALGGSISNLDMTNLETASIMLKDLKAQFQGFVTVVMANVLPTLLAVVNSFGSATDKAMMIRDTMKGLTVYIAGFVAVVKNIARAVRIVLTTVAIGAGLIVTNVAEAIGTLAKMAAKLPNALGGDTFKKAAVGIEAVTEKWRANLDQMRNDVHNDVVEIGNEFERMGAWVAKVEEDANKIAKGAAAIRNAGGATPIAFVNKQLLQDAADAFREVQTPMQAFADKYRKLNDMVMAGAISWNTYSRGVMGAVKQLEDAHQLSSLAMPQAMLQGSSETANKIAQAQVADDRRYRESPQDRIKRILEQSLDIEKRQLEEAKRLAAAAANQKVVRF